MGWGGGTHRRVGAWLAVPKRGKSREGLACLGGGKGLGGNLIFRVVWGSGKGWLGGARARGGGPRASVPGGVGGKGTGPRDGANFATFVVFLSFLTRKKEEKWRFLKDALWGGGGVPTGAGLFQKKGQGGGARFASCCLGVREGGVGGGVQGLRFRGGGRW